MKYFFVSMLVAITMTMLLSGCHPCREAIPETRVTQVTHFDNLSSASAASWTDQKLFLAGDDIPWLVSLNKDQEITDRLSLSHIDSLINGRTPGSIKADFEAMAPLSIDGKNYLLVLSSGSKPISRDTAYLIDLSGSEPVYAHNIRRLYHQLCMRSDFPEEKLNIEGLAIDEHYAYLFQRGNLSRNLVFRIPLRSFFNFIRHQTIMPETTTYEFELPEYEGVKAGFSGACMSPDHQGIFFTASLENNASSLADGEIGSSFVGYIPLCKMSRGTYHMSRVINTDGQPLTMKLESITIAGERGNDEYEAIAVVDNDDGTSDILNMNLTLR